MVRGGGVCGNKAPRLFTVYWFQGGTSRGWVGWGFTPTKTVYKVSFGFLKRKEAGAVPPSLLKVATPAICKQFYTGYSLCLKGKLKSGTFRRTST